MTLIFMEGFDDGLTVSKGWSSASSGSVAGRFGGKSLNMLYYMSSTHVYPSPLTGTVVVGVAVSPSLTTLTASLIIQGMVCVKMATGGFIALYRSDNNTQVAISTSPVWSAGNVWRYVELKYTPSTGVCEIRIDGTFCVSGTVPTAASASALVLSASSSSSMNVLFDDLYVLDSTGTTNNDYLGDVWVQTLLPSADGSNSGMTPDSGTTHFSRVNEAVPDTTSYVSTATVGVKDTYKYQQLAANTSAVYAVAVSSYTSKDAPVVSDLATVVRMGATDYVNAQPQALSASWATGIDLYQTRPSDSAPWTPTDVNSAEFGMQSS